jgi:caffeoyl-CoA O-methyltransferase
MKEFESIYKNNIEAKINEELVPRPNPIFLEMESFALEKKIPILSPSSGVVLKYLIQIYKPKKILELGTGLGYSTAWMISGNRNSEITTIDRNLREINRANIYLKNLYPETTINFLNEWCLAYLERNENFFEYDFCFIDCDKITYPKILEILSEKTKKGTILVFDNVLWHARIFSEEFSKPSDLAMKEFWKQLKLKTSEYTLFAAADGLVLLVN